MLLTRPVIVAVVAGGLPVTTVGVCAVGPDVGRDGVLRDRRCPPSAGAVQLTVACPLPGEAVTPLGVLGGLGAAGAEVLKMMVAASHGVFAPVAGRGAGGRAGGRQDAILGQELHVVGRRDVGAHAVAGVAGQGVGEARVGVEAHAPARRRLLLAAVAPEETRGRRRRLAGRRLEHVDDVRPGGARQARVLEHAGADVRAGGGRDRDGRLGARAGRDRRAPHAELGVVRRLERGQLGVRVAGRVGHARRARVAGAPHAGLDDEAVAARDVGGGLQGQARRHARAC